MPSRDAHAYQAEPCWDSLELRRPDRPGAVVIAMPVAYAPQPRRPPSRRHRLASELVGWAEELWEWLLCMTPTAAALVFVVLVAELALVAALLL